MGSLTDYAENALVKHLFGEAAYTPAATLYLAFATQSPGETATGASLHECANSGSYARAAVTFGAAASRRVTQNATATFGAATGSWGTVSHWAIVDSATAGAGNVLAYGGFAVPKVIVTGNTPSVLSGETYVELTASTGMGTDAAEAFLNRMFRNQAFTVAATYLGLVTATMTDSSTLATITEVTGGGYARKQVNAYGGSTPAWASAGSGNSVVNADAVTFADPAESWGTIVGAFMTDAASGTGGKVLWYDNGITDQGVGVGDTVQYAGGAISFSQS
jgi:hypothetical protein